MKKYITMLLFTSFSSLATVYSGEGYITGMFSGANNVTGVFHSATLSNPASCPNAKNGAAYLFDYESKQDWTKVHSLLLSAYIANKKVKIGVSASKCFSGYAVIERVAFVKGY